MRNNIKQQVVLRKIKKLENKKEKLSKDLKFISELLISINKKRNKYKISIENQEEKLSQFPDYMKDPEISKYLRLVKSVNRARRKEEKITTLDFIESFITLIPVKEMRLTKLEYKLRKIKEKDKVKNFEPLFNEYVDLRTKYNTLNADITNNKRRLKRLLFLINKCTKKINVLNEKYNIKKEDTLSL